MAQRNTNEDVLMSHPPFTRTHRAATSSVGRIDEGFSEAMDIEDHPASTPTPEPIDVDPTEQTLIQYPQWRDSLLQLPVELRATLFRDLMASLPTSQLATLIREADARLHLDPISLLPPEISTHLLQYLPPQDVTKAALISRRWRASANQPTIWRRLFALEGWHVRPEMIRQFESNARAQLELYLSRDRRADEKLFHHRVLMRARSKHGHGTAIQQDLDFMLVLQGIANPEAGFVYDRTLMHRLWVHATSLVTLKPGRHTYDGLGGSIADPFQVLMADSPELTRANPGLSCPLLYPEACWTWRSNELQLNWQHLFVQRQRLERNWRSGSYKTFRIPKLEFNHERHQECVYTLQFSAKHVVSGSRDQTIRIWDIETQRLTDTPLGRGHSVLYGHRGSVLCLQFDDRPDRDIIVSGGSDSCLIIWKFSSGNMVKHIKKAHSQAVLNLRFDDRYLVTCSKDSEIKIWNMARLSVTDDAYPAQNRSRDATYPDYIINKADLEANPNLGLSPPLEPFTHIMTLNGHTAAVNAISMFEDEIVSVSGDRKIMRWDLRAGRLLKTYPGHEKGIACVHYDGRRIVSGSSDESIRIFDPQTGAQVDRLNGHRDLVRTLQANFGDTAIDQAMYEAEAKAYSKRLLEKKKQKRLFNEIRHDEPRERNRSRNEEYIIGAKLPLGGGGNSWAKIVSGSYDETVILWTQNKKGRWHKAVELRHEDAVNATAARPTGPPDGNRNGQARGQQMAQNAHGAIPAVQHTVRVQQRQRNLQAQALAVPQQGVPVVGQAVTIPAAMAATVTVPAPHTQNLGPQTQPGQTAPNNTTLTNTIALNNTTRTNINATSRTAPGHPAQGQHHLAQPQHAQAVQHQVGQQIQQIAHQAHQQAQQQRQQQQEDEEGTSRLFNLQFDARRIVASSQQQVIVGWDFANGDSDIIEASQFFGQPL